jgi:hypothetical protein
MKPGPATILSCPLCGGKKAVMNLVSGNTFRATIWSDMRRKYPMFPQVSPIQQCPQCGRYYFTKQAERELGASGSFSSELGNLTFEQLKEARQQFELTTLTEEQNRVINHQLLMAYNDNFQRTSDDSKPKPSEEDLRVFEDAACELINYTDSSEEARLSNAEFLRELGRFSEAKAQLTAKDNPNTQWIVDKMLKHIEECDKRPFLLYCDGERVE